MNDACDTYRPLLAGRLFGELGPEEGDLLDAHLEACDDCTQALAELRATLDVMDQRERPAPPADFWDRFDASLERRFDEHDRQQASEEAYASPGAAGSFLGRIREGAAALRTRLQVGPAWARQGALALLLVGLGLVLGRTVFAPAPPPSVADQQRAAQRGGTERSVTVRRARLHLARAKTLLLEVGAFQPGPGATPLTDKQAEARQLAGEADTLRAALAAEGEQRQRLHALLNELHDVLAEIAALKGPGDSAGLDLVRSRIEDSDLILRINLEELQIAGTLDPTMQSARLQHGGSPAGASRLGSRVHTRAALSPAFALPSFDSTLGTQ